MLFPKVTKLVPTDVAVKDGKPDGAVLAEALKTLSSKRKEMHELSDDEWLQIADEIEDIICNHEDQWGPVNNWCLEEARVLKTCSREMADRYAGKRDVEPVTAPEHVYNAASIARSTIPLSLLPVLRAAKNGIRYRKALREQREQNLSEPSYVPNILKNKTEIDTVKGKFDVYGKQDLAFIPDHKVENWCRKDFKETFDDSLKGTEIPEDVMKPESDPNTPGFTLVLGAGNQATLASNDTVQMLFMRKDPVLIKHHPVRAHLFAPYEIIFRPLIKRGYLQQMADHGIEFSTKHLLSSPLLSHLHITGAYATVEKLETELAKTRPGKSKEEIASMFSSELGNCTPLVVTPGVYTDIEMKHSANVFLTSRKLQGGSNCLANQVLVLPKNWKQKDEFRKIFYEEAAAMKKDPTYYPGAIEKRRNLVASYEKAGKAKTVKTDLCFDTSGDPALQKEFDAIEGGDDIVVVECGTPGEEGFNKEAMVKESFSAVAAIVELEGGGEDQDPTDYLMKSVVPFLNDKSMIYGTLVCTVVHPESVELSNDFIAAIKYGSVCINTSSFMGYGVVYEGGRWGGHAMEPLHQSGREYIGNYFCLPRLDKSVIYKASGLKSSLVLDQNNKPPALVHDAVSWGMMSTTYTTGAIRIATLMIMRFVQLVTPAFILNAVFGRNSKASYGSSIFVE